MGKDLVMEYGKAGAAITRAACAFVLLMLAATAVLAAGPRPTPETEGVEAILADIDPWVVSDTTRIVEFIGRHNAATEERITSSPHWQTTLEELTDILGIDYLGAPQVDSTGRIYFAMRLTGEQSALFSMDRPRAWPTQITPNGWTEKGLEPGTFRLDPDGDYLYLRVMKHGDEDWDIWRFERDGSYRVLLEDRAISFGMPHIVDDDSFYFTIDNTEQIWLARYDVSTAAVDTLYTEPGAYYLIDHKDGKLACIRFLSFSESQIIEFDVATGDVRELTPVGIYWSADYTVDGEIVTLTDALSAEGEHLKVAAFTPGDDPAEPGDMRLIYDPGLEIDDAYFNRDAGAACVVLNREGYAEVVTVDLAGSVSEIPLPGVGIVSEPFMDAGGTVAFSFNSPSTTPTGFVMLPEWETPVSIGEVATFGYDFTGTNVSVVHYPSTDGEMIPALLYLPEGAERDGATPFIVEYHGGPPGQSRPYFQRNIAYILSRGVGFLFPNVRGSTGYGPAWERADNLEGRYQALEDAEAALDYLIDEGWTTPERTAIWGASYGGYTVNYLAVHAPEKFAVAVSDVGVADVDWSTEYSDQTFREGWEREMAPVGSELARNLSPIYFAGEVRRPMLITAGFNDPRVHPSGPRRFVHVLERLGKDAYYYEEMEAGHGATTKSMMARDLARSYAFMFDAILK